MQRKNTLQCGIWVVIKIAVLCICLLAAFSVAADFGSFLQTLVTPKRAPGFSYQFSNLHEQVTKEAAALSHKTTYLTQQALMLGLTAFHKVKQRGLSKKHYLAIIDYSKPSTQPRLWIIDPKTRTVLYHVLVAHGQGSGMLVPRYFSDKGGSKASSLGVYVTGDTYYGHNGYSLRLHGLEKGFNAHAYNRAIVLHGSRYVNERFIHQTGHIGRSFGCPAVDSHVAKPIINLLKGGSVVLAYYPNASWLHHSIFANIR